LRKITWDFFKFSFNSTINKNRILDEYFKISKEKKLSNYQNFPIEKFALVSLNILNPEKNCSLFGKLS
jgi:hypothetical protein